MDIRFCVTGNRRKALAAAVSESIGESAVYQYAPSFAYVIGAYQIDKEGTLMGPDNQDLLSTLAERGFTDPESDAAYGLAEAGEPPIGASGIPEIHDLVIEVPREGFTDVAIANLEKMIASKAALLRKALCADALTVAQTPTTLQFPWFTTDGSPEEAEAYSRLVFALCEAAKKQRRVTAKEKPVDNEKFAFRVFLIRLGFVGKDCKASRRVLLRNLEGNSAFKSGKPPKPEEVASDA